MSDIPCTSAGVLFRCCDKEKVEEHCRLDSNSLRGYHIRCGDGQAARVCRISMYSRNLSLSNPNPDYDKRFWEEDPF